MRIAYLSPAGVLGGAERVLMDVLATVRESAPEWSLKLIVAADGPLVARATALGVSATTLGFPPALRNIGDAAAGGSAGQTIRRSALIAQLLTAAPEVAMYIYRLGRELRGFAPDVIHANGFKMHVLGILA